MPTAHSKDKDTQQIVMGERPICVLALAGTSEHHGLATSNNRFFFSLAPRLGSSVSKCQQPQILIRDPFLSLLMVAFELSLKTPIGNVSLRIEASSLSC